jgi:hypothetical protein
MALARFNEGRQSPVLFNESAPFLYEWNTDSFGVEELCVTTNTRHCAAIGPMALFISVRCHAELQTAPL